MSTRTFLTANELQQMPQDDSVQTELDEEEVITISLAGGEHGACGASIWALLGQHVNKNRLGKVYATDTGFRLRDDTVRAPDVSFVRTERLEAVHRRGFCVGCSDLAVEIFSPTDSVRQLMRKVKQYFAAGCHTVWIVYPDRWEVNVLEASGTDLLLHENDFIEAPELLPGFSVPVAEFFAG